MTARVLTTTGNLTETDARELTASISGTLVDMATLPERVQRAYDGRAWAAMGYRSWGDYVHSEYEGALAALGRAEKKEIHKLLRELGTSTRDIAAMTGASKDTVHRDSATVSVATVESRDGKGRPSTRAVDAEIVEEHEYEDDDGNLVVESGRKRDEDVIELTFDLSSLPCQQPAPEEPRPEVMSRIRRGESLLGGLLESKLHPAELAELTRALVDLTDAYNKHYEQG